LKDGAARSETMRPDVGGSGERDDADVVAHDQCVPDVAATAGDQVDHAARKYRPLREFLTKFSAGEGRQRRRLEHDGVAAHKRRNDLPGRDGHRKIPRRDDRAHAERLTHRHRELVTQLRGDGLAVLPASFSGHEERHVDGFLDVAARLVQHLSHLAGHVARERFLAIGEELRGAE